MLTPPDANDPFEIMLYQNTALALAGLTLLLGQRIQGARNYATIAFALGIAIFVLGPLLGFNPFTKPIALQKEAQTLFNVMAYSYLPATFALGFAAHHWRRQRPHLSEGLGYGAAASGLLYLLIEVRQYFANLEGTAEIELWCYSFVMLLYALTLLGLALTRKQRLFRVASLTVLSFATAKVFLVDLSFLEGLWRALSFLGLGMVMLGIGWIYQRHVFLAPHPTAESTDTQA